MDSVKPLTIAVAVGLLALTGCGTSSGSGAATTESGGQTTSASEARELSRALQGMIAADGETRDAMAHCRTLAESESGQCMKEAGEQSLLKVDEAKAIVNELKSTVGPNCRKALVGGTFGEEILAAHMVAVCTADVGS